HWACLTRGEQPLRLPDGDAGAEEDGDAAGAKERLLLAQRVAFEALDDRLRRLLGLVVQLLDRRRRDGLRLLRQPARRGGQVTKRIAQARGRGRLVRGDREGAAGARLVLVPQRTLQT